MTKLTKFTQIDPNVSHADAIMTNPFENHRFLYKPLFEG